MSDLELFFWIFSLFFMFAAWQWVAAVRAVLKAENARLRSVIYTVGTEMSDGSKGTIVSMWSERLLAALAPGEQNETDR